MPSIREYLCRKYYTGYLCVHNEWRNMTNGGHWQFFVMLRHKTKEQ